MSKIYLTLTLFYVKHPVLFQMLSITTLALIIQLSSSTQAFCDYIRNPETIGEEMYNESQYIPRDIDLVLNDGRGTITTLHGDGRVTVKNCMGEVYTIHKLNRHEEEYYSIYPPNNPNEVVSADGKRLIIYKKRFNNYSTFDMGHPSPGIMTDIITPTPSSGEISYVEYVLSFSRQQQVEIIFNELFSVVKENINKSLSLKHHVFNALENNVSRPLWVAKTESDLTNGFSSCNLLLNYIKNYVQNHPELSKGDINICAHICTNISVISGANVLHESPLRFLDSPLYVETYNKYYYSLGYPLPS